MVRTRKTRNLKRRAPLWIYLAAGVSAVTLVALVVLFTTRTVHADASLPQTTITASASAAAATETLASPANAEPPIPRNGPTPEARRWKDRIHGVASWYGGVFNGRKTASGETYDMEAMTACHPSLPFGSIVRVINRRNHRSVVVRITDRGDLVEEGRVIDLSYGAAQKLGITWDGLARVDLQVLTLGKTKDRD